MKSYERLVDMFNRASEEYRSSMDKCLSSTNVDESRLHKTEMEKAAERVNVLYDVAEEVFGKSHKAFAEKAREKRMETGHV